VFVVDERAAGGIEVRTPAPGDPVPLIEPPQGGFVIYAGIRLRNLDPCGVVLTGELVDPSTGTATSNRDRREADLEEEPGSGGGDGGGGGAAWFRPSHLESLATIPNVPACPDALGVGVEGVPALLRVKAADRGGRSITVEPRVVPTCGPGGAQEFCRCTCGPGFVPGKCRAPDGGTRDGGGTT